MSDSIKKPLPSTSNRPRFKAGTVIKSSTGEEVKIGGSFISDDIIEAVRSSDRPRYKPGTVIRSTSGQEVKVGGRPISSDIVSTVREWEASQEEAESLSTPSSSEATPTQNSDYQQPTRMQRIGAAVSRSASVVSALGPLGVIRSINRAANAEGGASLIDFDRRDAMAVRGALADSNNRNLRDTAIVGSNQSSGILGGNTERLLFTISTNINSVKNTLSRIDTSINKIVETIVPPDAPKKVGGKGDTKEEGGGGIMGLIGSLFGGIGNLFGGGGGAGLGAVIRRLIGTVARAIFTKIPIIGPLILVALNIEGAMEEYEKNGLGAAVTELIAGIGSDLTFGIIDKDTIKNIINSSLQTLQQWWTTGTEALQNILGGIVETITGFFRWATDTLKDFLDRFRRRRNALEEAARAGDEERLNNLSNMSPRELAGAGPGRVAARRMAESRNVSNRELEDIQELLESAEEGETPEQKAERLKLDAQLKVLERTEGQADGGLRIPAELNQYIEDRRSRARGTTTPTTPPAPERVPSAEPTSNAPNVENPVIQNRINELMQIGMPEQQARETAISEYNNINSPVSNNVTPTEAVPASDIRPNQMSQGANEPNVVVMQAPAAPTQAPAPSGNAAGAGVGVGGAAGRGGRNTVPQIPTTPAQALSNALGRLFGYG